MWVTSKASSYSCALLIVLTVTIQASSLQLDNDVDITLLPVENGIDLILTKGSEEKLVGTIGIGSSFKNAPSCIGQIKCAISDDVTLSIRSISVGFQITWETKSASAVFKDCYDLKVGEVNWYGGPQRLTQKWPIEKLNLTVDEAYIIKKTDHFAIAERYWLNSKGAYIFVDDRAPLFIDQNNEDPGKVCFIAKLADRYVNRERIIFNYTIVARDNAKLAHLHAVNNYLGKPQGYPDVRMIKYPIWTTWAIYKKSINDDIVTNFAQVISDNGYSNGQIEIDDNWEQCYGTLEFNENKFSNISTTLSTLKELGFRIALWVHPFINSDCESLASEGKEKGYFAKDAEGNTNATWWNGVSSNEIDFTNPDAAEWYSARLRKLQDDYGIDTFKFDAGEVDWLNTPTVYDNNVDVETVPNILTESYLRNCAKFGGLIEIRSSWRTQDLPVFVRMVDKQSRWDENNGLHSLITTLLQMNMNGYTMVLPDMIGGNGYGVHPPLELLVRWTQANVFMPAMQFSYLPWDYNETDYDGAAIVKKFIDLHQEYTNDILTAMNSSIENGSPVNAPIWWIDPTDIAALANDDEFLLGKDILVAPVYEEGATSRNVYLPKGSWKDGNSDVIYNGPLTINDYSAPIDILPYFIRQ